MTVALSAPAILSSTAGVILLLLIGPALRHRDVPGAPYWIGLLATTGFWAVSYGVGLTVFDPEIRVLFDVANYLAMSAAVVLLVAAGLSYTGYGYLIRSPWMMGLVAVGGASWLLIATNALGLHSLVWHSYRVEPVLGAAGVRFEPTVVFYLIAVIAYGAVAVSTILALETMLRYGSLYRGRAVAIAVSGVPVGLANVIWFLDIVWSPTGLTPVAGLNLTPMSFLAMAIVNGYVLATGGFFDVAPATRRIAERVAIDDVATALVMVNDAGLIVGMNDTAVTLFDVDDREAAMARPFQDVTESSVAFPLETPLTTSFPVAPSRTFEVSTSPILDHADRSLGYTVTIQDVTRQLRRQQRLEVFNRVLRHNLRNDLTVIQGNAERLAEEIASMRAGPSDTSSDTSRRTEVSEALPRSGDGDLAAAARRIVQSSQALLRTADKARDVVRASPDATPESRPVDVVAVLDEVVEELVSERPETTVRVDAPDECVVETDPDLLRVVLQNLIENAVIHGEQASTVDVSVVTHEELEDGAGRIAITVADDGPGIPETELAPIRQGHEDQLHHGSGIGLWIVSWCVDDLGGEIVFETGDDGTTVTVTIPSRPME